MSKTQSMRRTHWLQFVVGISLYAVLVIVQSLFLEPGALPLWAMIPVALVPMVPAVWAMVGVVQGVRDMDELQRRIHLEAGIYALSATALLTFSYGFLEVYAQFPRISMFFVWAIIAASYAGGQALSRRAYE